MTTITNTSHCITKADLLGTIETVWDESTKTWRRLKPSGAVQDKKKFDNCETNTNMTTTTIHNLSEIINYSRGTPMFPSDYYDASRHFNLPLIKRKYGFHSRSKVYVLVECFEDKEHYIKAYQNTDNKQIEPTFCNPENLGAEHGEMMGKMVWVSYYPYGNVKIFGETEDDKKERLIKKKRDEKIKRMKKEMSKNIKKCNDYITLKNMLKEYESNEEC